MLRNKMEKWFEKYMSSSLRKKLNMLILVIVVPLLILEMCLVFNIWKASKEYERNIQNVTEASQFNFDFKKNIDGNIYKIITGAFTFEQDDPYKEIDEARELVQNLQKTTRTTENRLRLSRIGNTLNNLEKLIREFQMNYKKSTYEDNVYWWEINVCDVTDLVKDGMSDYIYYEATYLNDIKEDISKQVDIVIGISIGAFILITMFAVGLSYVISASITKPIESLCKYAKQVGKGDFSVRVEEGGDEIQELSYSLNQMVRRIGRLMEDVKEEQVNLRKTELKLLQSQINPHFLYNTLDTIIWLAEDQQNAKTIEMVKSLSQFFRTSLSKGEDFIMLSTETCHVKSYLEIQQFRYQDILEYEIHIPEELSAYKILKLTLQPIVENSLYHGIKTTRRKGKITITGQCKEECILLTVEDNGRGMKPDELEKVRKSIENTPKRDSDTSFGLFNVNERIQLNYGKEYGIEIESEYEVGTKVTVKIPVIL